MCALKEKEKSEQNLEVQNRTVFLYQYLPIALLCCCTDLQSMNECMLFAFLISIFLK